MEWLLEIILILLLAATLFHSLRLERALGILKRDRTALEDLVVAFNDSTRQAEQGIERLRNAADGAGQQISRQVDLSGGLKEDLRLLIERGERLADELERSIRTLRSNGAAFTDLAPLASGYERHDPPRLIRSANGYPSAEPDVELVASEPDPRLRSQAERDLLKALKLVR